MRSNILYIAVAFLCEFHVLCKCSFVETTDTQSYITPPIHDSLPDLTSYRICLLSWIWHHHFVSLSLVFTSYWIWHDWIKVSMGLLQREWHANRERLLLRTPGPVPLGLAYVLLVETNPFCAIVVIFSDYALRISLGTFSILLLG